MCQHQPSCPYCRSGEHSAPAGVTGLRAPDRVDRAMARQRQFAADASHELRTPLSGLRAQLEEARLYPGDTDVAELADRALGDVDRLQAIVADLLLLARPEPDVADAATGSAADVDLAGLARDEAARRPGRVPVDLHLSPGVLVRGSAELLGRALAALLDNAQRHARDTVRIQVRQAGGAAELAVSDDGDGIAEAGREEAFGWFTRLGDPSRCRAGGGTGLGLAVVRSIARAHGGTVEAGHADDGGARLVLRLPLAPAVPRPSLAGAGALESAAC